MMDLETLKRENEKVAGGDVPYWRDHAIAVGQAVAEKAAKAHAERHNLHWSQRGNAKEQHQYTYTVVWQLRSTIDYLLTYYSTQVIPAHYGFSSLPATPQMWLDLAETVQFGLEGAPVGNVPVLSMVLLGAAQRIEPGT